MTKERRFVILSYIALVLIIIIVTMVWQAHQIRRQMQELEPVSAFKQKESKPEGEGIKSKLIPSRPEDYGMIVTNRFDKPKDQAEWDEFLGERLSALKPAVRQQDLSKIRAMIDEPAERMQDKFIKIDQAIEECRTILKDDPGNEKAQERLERLMILKGLGDKLKDF